MAGDKGTGKTAIYRILLTRARTKNSAIANTSVIEAFNLTGNSIFQELLHVAEQPEGIYIAFWKTYLLSLVGNWLVENVSSLKASDKKRLDQFLSNARLRSIDISPRTILNRVASFFKTNPVKSVEVGLEASEAGLPRLTPKVVFEDDESSLAPKSFFGVDYAQGLSLIETVLQQNGQTAWVALDRLDEAFQGFPKVELSSLRALLRTYLDLQEYRHLRLKLFLRKDLFRKIIGTRFVNLTHVNAKKIEITWDEEELKHLLVARVKDSKTLVRELQLNGADDDEVFSRLFPDKISQGEHQSTTWNWIVARIKDGNDVIAPRNLIDLVEKAKEEQLRADNRTPREYKLGTPLFEPLSVKKAHRALSTTRVNDTLFIEAPELVPLLRKFRDQKAEHSIRSLQNLLGVSGELLEDQVKQLREIGFLEVASSSSYKVPPLYRFGLGIKQGKATSDE